jgi:hypothetical protein
MWRPQRDSNPCFGLERATSWASGRWGRVGQKRLSYYGFRRLRIRRRPRWPARVAARYASAARRRPVVSTCCAAVRSGGGRASSPSPPRSAREPRPPFDAASAAVGEPDHTRATVGVVGLEPQMRATNTETPMASNAAATNRVGYRAANQGRAFARLGSSIVFEAEPNPPQSSRPPDFKRADGPRMGHRVPPSARRILEPGFSGRPR